MPPPRLPERGALTSTGRGSRAAAGRKLSSRRGPPPAFTHPAGPRPGPPARCPRPGRPRVPGGGASAPARGARGQRGNGSRRAALRGRARAAQGPAGTSCAHRRRHRPPLGPGRQGRAAEPRRREGPAAQGCRRSGRARAEVAATWVHRSTCSRRVSPSFLRKPAYAPERAPMSESLRPRAVIVRAVGLVALLGVVVLAIDLLVPGAGARIADADPAWLAVAVALEALALAGYVALFHAVFSRPPHRLRVRRSAEIALGELAGFALVPAGAGGPAVRFWALRGGGMPWPAIGARSVTYAVLFNVPYLAAALVFGVGVVSGVVPGHAPDRKSTRLNSSHSGI